MSDKEMLTVNEWESEPTFKSLIQSNGQAVRVYTPSPRLFIIGAVHIAQALVPMAQSVGYDVVVIDPRSIFLESERWSYVKRVSDFPEEYLPTQHVGPHDAVVALSHNPIFDDEALFWLWRRMHFMLVHSEAERITQSAVQGCRNVVSVRTGRPHQWTRRSRYWCADTCGDSGVNFGRIDTGSSGEPNGFVGAYHRGCCIDGGVFQSDARGE